MEILLVEDNDVNRLYASTILKNGAVYALKLKTGK